MHHRPAATRPSPASRITRAYPAAMLVLLLGFALVLPGCDAFVKSAMLDAPNRGQTFNGETHVLTQGPAVWGIDHELYIPVGPPEAVLRLWIKEPAADAEPKGTLLILHGWRNESFFLRHVGDAFTNGGFRAIHVDLRGHGGSTGDVISFGAIESHDLTQVLDALADADVIAGPLGVWGASMGAATAIQFAAQDDRVEAVVAVAPYTSMRDVAPITVRRLLPLMHLASDEDLQRMIEEGAAEHGFDPDDADTLAAVGQLSAPLLVIHGKNDLIVPPEHGRAIYEAAAGPAELIELDWIGHFTAHYSGDMAAHSLDFFNRTLVPDPAPTDP